MTLLSVVLPVHDVQGYLRQCLDSLLGQSFTDFEIIAVDDASPDRSGEILAEYAVRDARVRVVTMPENVGMGRARNAGLEVATGEYVWFVDSDDRVAEHVLGAVARRLRETNADVLIVGFDRVHWDGRVEADLWRRTLTGAPATFTAEAYPKILNVLHVIWNKVVRRDVLVKLGLRFEPGWYEDVSFTYPLILTAERISVLPRVCVHYRRRRSGSATVTMDDRHFEIFEHWSRALALVDRYAPDTTLRPHLVRRMIWHYLVTLRDPARLRRGSRKRFFERMHADFVRYQPSGGYSAPPGFQGVRHRLVGRGNYPLYQAFDLAGRLRDVAVGTLRRGTGVARRLLGRARQAIYRVYYRGQLLRPIDQRLALYAAYWYRGVSCNPAAIAAAAERLAPEIRNVWVVHRDRVATIPPGTDHVVAGTLRYYRSLARARWLINNVNWPQPVVKRSGATHVMTHHGTPLKRMGLDQAAYPVAATDTDFAAQMKRVDRWDYSVTANAHTTVAWSSAYPAGHETLEVGYPRNDRLAVATAEEISRVRAELGLAPDENVVLYAPTHREWLPPGTPVLDIDDLSEQLGAGTVLLARTHYFAVPAGAEGPRRRGRIIDVSAHPVVEDLYLAADVLITDYSSAMFDFAVLDRPIVIYAPDWDIYRQLRGVYFDLMSRRPGSVATSYPELVEDLRSGRHLAAEATAARTRFRESFCSLDDGRAAERVVRRVLLP
ncbi:CDP-glycerol glycerophosphotransferase family protein [Actinoplanes sp. NPDC051633]|uniref:bifunctional glycosyltransferase/CDP-glycerol:glycerophosphate glycerophosphotransferase n=1 Tax=Actinoplanes sp. NPDC051633 TaxID=3155670 RepID=UPI003445BCDB